MFTVPRAPVRPTAIVSLHRSKEADFKFEPTQIYKSSSLWHVPVFMKVLSRTSDQTIMIKAAEGAFDEETLAKLENASIMEVSLFTDKNNNAEYTYVLARRMTVLSGD